ncbi:hypothetical protein BT67DRAFT_232524 [Trichocladium antarcticum]|uniref:Uncharacterized protein n=1 Tax=Trichocladium antarcticum TaxID=1450529 RepID=A0AAN6ZF78_9PEZI|nr:hypothetical protein BT67DRAFT_232524 [Trichocladium antarcticum]
MGDLADHVNKSPWLSQGKVANKERVDIEGRERKIIPAGRVVGIRRVNGRRGAFGVGRTGAKKGNILFFDWSRFWGGGGADFCLQLHSADWSCTYTTASLRVLETLGSVDQNGSHNFSGETYFVQVRIFRSALGSHVHPTYCWLILVLDLGGMHSVIPHRLASPPTMQLTLGSC